MKNCTCVWRNIRNTARASHSRYYEYFAKHACNFSLILLEPCNFLYKFYIFSSKILHSICNSCYSSIIPFHFCWFEFDRNFYHKLQTIMHRSKNCRRKINNVVLFEKNSSNNPVSRDFQKLKRVKMIFCCFFFSLGENSWGKSLIKNSIQD